MKKTAFVFRLLLLLLPVAAAGSDDALIAIKKAYAETAAAIALGQKGEAGGLYCNELIVNSRNGSWRGSGNYLKKAAFWYVDQPEFAAAEGKKPEGALAKVEIRETAAAVSAYSEFLYVNGEPVFFMRSENGDKSGEERIYFKEGKVLRRLLDTKETATAPDLPKILREAVYWQNVFLGSFGDDFPAPRAEHPIDAWLSGRMRREPSSQEMNACLGQAYEKWDAELNRVYRELGAKLAGDGQATLRHAQRSWVAFRDSELAWLAAFYGGRQGSMYANMLAADRVELVRRRVLELSSWLELLAQP